MRNLDFLHFKVLKNPRRFELSSDSEDEEKNEGKEIATMNLQVPAQIQKEKVNFYFFKKIFC